MGDPGTALTQLVIASNTHDTSVIASRTTAPISSKYAILESPDDYLSQAYYLLNRFTFLFADLILGYDERQDCHSMICDKSSEEAFEIRGSILATDRSSRPRGLRFLLSYPLRLDKVIATAVRKSKPCEKRFLNKLSIEEKVAKRLNVEYEEVDAEVKSLMFQELKQRSENIDSLFNVSSCKKLLSYRGEEIPCFVKWNALSFSNGTLLLNFATSTTPRVTPQTDRVSFEKLSNTELPDDAEERADTDKHTYPYYFQTFTDFYAEQRPTDISNGNRQ
ncbi:hypothetical protein F3Y22_tig00110691pilonHSYRG00103 [Hibiscus syriacus]|uniref:Uncharacterized protein n=1 Tax=Hibiscus syriacus TaxID=106335 RepID=A0A6A2ZVK2_HIBSY|nr:hypothetical protein F3Y22_tig00110691pilonHSYRG00103 [Hibiscus syriacus]